MFFQGFIMIFLHIQDHESLYNTQQSQLNCNILVMASNAFLSVLFSLKQNPVSFQSQRYQVITATAHVI